ncbi:hypothetical protein M2275_008140 [Rhodococcus opacus]|nr:hypothetical protein [Rhodococcus opacus]
MPQSGTCPSAILTLSKCDPDPESAASSAGCLQPHGHVGSVCAISSAPVTGHLLVWTAGIFSAITRPEAARANSAQGLYANGTHRRSFFRRSRPECGKGLNFKAPYGNHVDQRLLRWAVELRCDEPTRFPDLVGPLQVRALSPQPPQIRGPLVDAQGHKTTPCEMLYIAYYDPHHVIGPNGSAPRFKCARLRKTILEQKELPYVSHTDHNFSSHWLGKCRRNCCSQVE